MRQSEQLERETEQTRAELAETIEELRARVTPGYVVDELLDYARDSTGAEFFDNLKRQVAANPLPVGLMGAGLAWLMMARGSRDTPTGAVENAARQAGASVGDAADAAVASVRETASATSDAVASTSATMAESARQTAADVARSARELRASATGTGRALADFCREQPLVVAGIGIALGAAIGALLPATETEDRLMGQASDAAKQQAKDMAVAQATRARDAMQEGPPRDQMPPERSRERGEPGVAAAGHEASLVPSHETEPAVPALDDAEQRGAEVERELQAHAERLARERSQ
jgi:Protein of unknown function (DUF3618)